MIGKIISELPTDLSECSAIQGDVTKIENWAKIFAHPAELVKQVTENLIMNWATVFGDVSKVESDWTSSNFYNAGDDIADILVLTVGKVT